MCQKLKTQFGISATADLEELTWTFVIPHQSYRVSAGEFAIVPKENYDNIISMLNKILSIENAAFGLKGFDVERLKSEINEVVRAVS